GAGALRRPLYDFRIAKNTAGGHSKSLRRFICERPAPGHDGHHSYGSAAGRTRVPSLLHPRLTMIHNWMRMLLAILLGNLIYFATYPLFPPVLKHDLYQVDAGLALDFALCVGIYLLLRT